MSKGPRKNEISGVELCRALGITTRTLVQWRKDGCPFRRSAPHNRAPIYYVLADVQRWMSDQSRSGRPGRPITGVRRSSASDEEPQPEAAELGEPGEGLSTVSTARLNRLAHEADVALKQARAEKEQLAVEKARGELVLIEEVLREATEVVSRVRSRLLGLPGALAGPCARERDPVKVEKLIDEAVRANLEALAEGLKV